MLNLVELASECSVVEVSPGVGDVGHGPAAATVAAVCTDRLPDTGAGGALASLQVGLAGHLGGWGGLHQDSPQ